MNSLVLNSTIFCVCSYTIFNLSQVLAVQCDVRDSESVNKAVTSSVETLGLPNIVINNAAGNFIAPTERLSTNAWRTVVDIVLNGTANVTLDVAKRLIAASQGMQHHFLH